MVDSDNIAPQFDSVEDTIGAFRNGNFIIVLDDLSRENEGDLIIAAEAMTPRKMAFMIRYTSGLICAPLPAKLCEELDLPQMVAPSKSSDPNRTAYTVSIDAEHESTTTGISAEDRARTCNFLAAEGAKATDFRRPGHLLPLRARDGGVRERAGHTEAAVEFCRLAGMRPVGVISELVAAADYDVVGGTAELDEVTMMNRDGCLAFGRRWGLKVLCIEDLVAHVEAREGKLQTQANDV